MRAEHPESVWSANVLRTWRTDELAVEARRKECVNFGEPFAGAQVGERSAGHERAAWHLGDAAEATATGARARRARGRDLVQRPLCRGKTTGAEDRAVRAAHTEGRVRGAARPDRVRLWRMETVAACGDGAGGNIVVGRGLLVRTWERKAGGRVGEQECRHARAGYLASPDATHALTPTYTGRGARPIDPQAWYLFRFLQAMALSLSAVRRQS